MGWWRSSAKPLPAPASGTEIFLRSRPTSSIVPDEHFGTRTVPIPDPLSIPSGFVLVRVNFVSVDPAMRGWMSSQKSYVPPVPIGEPMRAFGTGIVLSASESSLPPGTVVVGPVGWREYSVVEVSSLRKVHVPYGVSESAMLGALGHTGLTAYFGLKEVGRLKHGDVVMVSAAAGATGSVASQIAKHVYNCFVVGIAGGKEKCAYLTDELGLDVAVDYKSEIGVEEGLKRGLGGRKVNVYFDNVGGETLEAALRRLAQGGRVVLCGGISGYNVEGGANGPRNYLSLIVCRGSMQGFIVTDYEEQFDVAMRELAKWIKEGKIKFREDVVEGLQNAPNALLRLFEGRNIGKVIVKVAGEDVTKTDQGTMLRSKL